MSDDAPNNEKEELQAALRVHGVQVNDAWEIPALRRKLTMVLSQEDEAQNEEPAPIKAQKPKAKGDMVQMKLLKHYRPGDESKVEVVGYHREEKLTKDAAGQMHVIQSAAFIQGEMAPPPLPGVGYAGKIWAGTVVRLPREEAMRMYEHKIAERGFD